MLNSHRALEAVSYFSQHIKDTDPIVQPSKIAWANEENDLTLAFLLEHTGWKRPGKNQEYIQCYSPFESSPTKDMFEQWFNIPRWQVISSNSLHESIHEAKQKAIAKLQKRINERFPSTKINVINTNQETASLQTHVRECIGKLRRPTKAALENAVRSWKPTFIAAATADMQLPLYLDEKESLATCLPLEVAETIVKLATAI